MQRVLDFNKVDYMLFELEIKHTEEDIKNNQWIITDDKSKDEIRTKSDDKVFPYIVLKNGQFFEAITKNFYNEILRR